MLGDGGAIETPSGTAGVKPLVKLDSHLVLSSPKRPDLPVEYETSNWLTLYPYSTDEQQKFGRLIDTVKSNLPKIPSTRDTYEVLEMFMGFPGLEDDERRFLSKIYEFVVLEQYAYARPLDICREPFPNEIINHLGAFPEYYQVAQDDKESLRLFREKLDAKKEELTPLKNLKNVHIMLDEFIEEHGGFKPHEVLYSNLRKFIKGLRLTLYGDYFKHKLGKYVDHPSVRPEEKEAFSSFLSDVKARFGSEFWLYQINHLLENQDSVRACPGLEDKIKTLMDLVLQKTDSRLSSPSPRERLDDFNESKLSQRKRIAEKDDRLETWDFMSGVYNRPLMSFNEDEKASGVSGLLKDTSLQNPLETPGYVESFIGKRIDQLLKANPGKPVMVLDFGGMLSVTFVRIAERYQKEIESGQLVVAVTNLVADEQKIDSLWKRQGDLYPWFKKNSHLIHYIQADAQELQDMVIKTKQGELPIKGNVSLIHEHGSIGRHGTINDMDFPLLAELLTKEGMLMTARYEPGNQIDSLADDRAESEKSRAGSTALNSGIFNTVKMQWDESAPPVEVEHYTNADRAKVAVENLHKMGYRVVDAIYDLEGNLRDLKYAMWLKPTALPLILQMFDGKEMSVPESYLK